jgi:DNA-binding transcriptional LysR family regulator
VTAAGRVRLAGFSSATASLVPRAAAALAGKHPGLRLSLTDTHPPDALELLRTGRVEVAIIFRYDETEAEPPDPPATAALLAALAEAATSATSSAVTSSSSSSRGRPRSAAARSS